MVGGTDGVRRRGASSSRMEAVGSPLRFHRQTGRDSDPFAGQRGEAVRRTLLRAAAMGITFLEVGEVCPTHVAVVTENDIVLNYGDGLLATASAAYESFVASVAVTRSESRFSRAPARLSRPRRSEPKGA